MTSNSQQSKNSLASHLPPAWDSSQTSHLGAFKKLFQPSLWATVGILHQDRITQSDTFGCKSNLCSWLDEATCHWDNQREVLCGFQQGQCAQGRWMECSKGAVDALCLCSSEKNWATWELNLVKHQSLDVDGRKSQCWEGRCDWK